MTVTLNDSDENTEYKIASVDNSNYQYAARLFSMGFIPGATVTVLSRNPHPLCKIGGHSFAIDDEMAGMVNIVSGKNDKGM